MSQSCKEFHFMETMLEKIKSQSKGHSSNESVRDAKFLEPARNEIEFKLRIGHSAVWTNIQKMDEFLERAIA
jgi:hypothetical protein